MPPVLNRIPPLTVKASESVVGKIYGQRSGAVLGQRAANATTAVGSVCEIVPDMVWLAVLE